MKLFFVRHGKDDDRFRGGWSTLDLVPEGVEQAQKLAFHLKAHQSQYQITRIISSDLPRTMTTAAYAAQALGLPVREEPQLRETNNGILAGMLNETALERYPGLFFSTLEMEERYPGGESPAAFYRRIRNWFVSFCGACREEPGNVLVVTHGGVINVVYHLVKDLPWSNRAPAFRAANCSLHILDLQTMEFEAENRTDFL